MLFDLRSKGRRRAVKVIYLFLALIMVAGLVLVGVGTGSNQGGLLNAFSNSSSSGGATSIYKQQVETSLKAVKKHPNSAAAWASLAQARYGAAGSGSNFDTTTGTYTKSGRQQLVLAAAAWAHYVKLANNGPSLELAFLGAKIYQATGQYKNESVAWNYALNTQATNSTSALKPYLCLALSSYAAGQTAKGDLAAAAAVRLAPKLQRLTLKSTLSSAKSATDTAKQTLLENC